MTTSSASRSPTSSTRSTSKCDLFLDVGAAFGYYSIILAMRFPSLAVIAFEPDERNIDQLRANLHVYRLADRITLYRAAASAQAGEVGFRPGPAASTGQSMVDAAAGEITVQTLTIDGVLNTSGKTICAKIDVEGHELEMLKGMEQTLRENRCLLQIETHRDHVAKVKDFLSAWGFTFTHCIEHDHYFVNFAIDTAPRAQTAR